MVDDEPDIIRDRVFLPYPLLLKAAKLARERNYNQQVTDEFIDDVLLKSDADQDFYYPIVTSYVHAHAQGEPVGPHNDAKFLGRGATKRNPLCL